jgi:hypothetical protein
MIKLAHIPFYIVAGLIAVALSVSPVFAMELQSIGTSSVTSQALTQWNYTSENPTLTGTAAANSTVTITIDGGSTTVTVDSTGSWSYKPTTLTTGDHTVSIAGDTQTVTFTISIGTSGSSSASGSATTLPNTGSPLMTIGLLGGGALLIVGGLKLRTIK